MSGKPKIEQPLSCVGNVVGFHALMIELAGFRCCEGLNFDLKAFRACGLTNCFPHLFAGTHVFGGVVPARAVPLKQFQGMVAHITSEVVVRKRLVSM